MTVPRPAPSLGRSVARVGVILMVVAIAGTVSVGWLGYREVRAAVAANAAFRAEKAVAVLTREIDALGHAMTRFGRDEQARALLSGDAAGSLRRVWLSEPMIWFAVGARGEVVDLGSPIEPVALIEMLGDRDEGIVAVSDSGGRWVMSRRASFGAWWVYGGLILDERDNTMETVRHESATPTIALLLAGAPIGGDESRRVAEKITTGLGTRERGPILDRSAYAVRVTVPDTAADLELLLSHGTDRLRRALRVIWMSTVLTGLVVAAAMWLLVRRLNRKTADGITQLRGYAERVVATDTVPAPTSTGLAELDRVGRAMAHLTRVLRDRCDDLEERGKRSDRDAVTARRSAERVTLLLDNLPAGVLATHRDGTVMYLNRMAESLTGWPREEALGLAGNKVIRLARPGTQGFLGDSLGSLVHGDFHGHDATFRLANREGGEVEIVGVARPFPGGSSRPSKGIVFVFRDETARMMLDKQRNQSRKLEAVGLMAGGFAHDVNNLLSVIMGHAELLRQDLSEQTDESLVAPLDAIIEVARGGAGLTRQLLALSVKGDKERRVLDAHRLLEEVFRITERALANGVGIARKMEAEHVHVTGSETELESALIKLMLEAQEAVSPGGRLSVRTANVDLDESFCRAQPHPVEPGTYLELSIGDTAAGASGVAMRGLFAPRGSDPETGPGGQPGPPGVYETVEDHGGLITGYSEPELGYLVKLYLPLTGLGEAPRHEEAENRLVRGEGLVLLVEDERIVREIAVTMLEQLGYGVIEAVNGREAIEKYRQFGDDIDLVILDMEMPVMGGREALVRLNRIDPEVRILIASGYSLDNEIREHFSAGRVRGFIQKPYPMARFSRLIAEILADEPAVLD